MTVFLPPFDVTQGEPAAFQFTVQGRDWTGYTGAVIIKASRRDRDALLTLEPTLGADGSVTVALTAEQTALLPALPRAGRFVKAVMQVRVTGATTETFQGNLSVSAQL